MATRLNCAFCGQPLESEGPNRYLVLNMGLPECPTVGWCSGSAGDCADQDDLFRAVSDRGDRDAYVACLRKIAARGPLRVCLWRDFEDAIEDIYV